VAGGTLTVANWLHVADNLMSTGSVLVTGGSLSITNGPTIIGNKGSGQLTISNSTVQARDVTIAAQLGSHGTLTLNNGTLATTSLFNNTNGFVMGVGTIDGPMTNAGTISPGFSPGKIFITGKLTLQPTSTVVMELGGTANTDYDQILISQDLAADGTLDVSLINAFTPANGDTFDIFGFTSSSGEFSITNLPALNPGLSWDTSNLMTIGELAVIPEPSTLFLAFAGCGVGVLLLRRRLRLQRAS
jgi:T5SS/PEP-CTERM-associated repeat protein